jgi:hypothetical protein
LVLTALPSAIPPVIRLRRLLKTLRRCYAFRCLEARELPPAAAQVKQKAA